ncbi:MAG: hypothetical protein ACRD2W_12060 [Acidimicrobiales bacterium]
MYVMARPDRFSSTAEVLVKPLTRDPLGSSDPFGDVAIDTEARAVSSDAVLRRASESLPDHPAVSGRLARGGRAPAHRHRPDRSCQPGPGAGHRRRLPGPSRR